MGAAVSPIELPRLPKPGRIEYWRVARLGRPPFWFFHLRAANGRILCTSEAYNTKRACRAGIASVVSTASVAAIVEMPARHARLVL
jgi:uncharacterized protein YegP (UPF0339 family)